MIKAALSIAVLIAALGLVNGQVGRQCQHTLLVTPVQFFKPDEVMGKWYGIEMYSGLTADAKPMPLKCLEANFSRSDSGSEDFVAIENFVDLESGEARIDTDRIVINTDGNSEAIWTVLSDNEEGQILNTDVVWLQTDYENWAIQFGCAIVDNYRYESLAIWSRERMIESETLDILRILANGYGYPPENIRPIDQMSC